MLTYIYLNTITLFKLQSYFYNYKRFKSFSEIKKSHYSIVGWLLLPKYVHKNPSSSE